MTGYLSDNDLKYGFDIVKSPLYEIDKISGNVINANEKIHLTKDGRTITKDYWNISSTDRKDHFMVCNLAITGGNINEPNCNLKDNKEVKFKYGVIKLKRQKNGKIIPFAEEEVVPIIYDRIILGNLHTLICSNNGKYTYVDFAKESKNYGKQIVPAVLDYALPFNIPYQGFAKCSLNGITGYLPRNFPYVTNLKPSALLTEDQVQNISYLESHLRKLRELYIENEDLNSAQNGIILNKIVTDMQKLEQEIRNLYQNYSLENEISYDDYTRTLK